METAPSSGSHAVLDSETEFRAWSESSGESEPAERTRSPKWAEDDLTRDECFPIQMGTWDVTGVLGRGGYGVVYLAREIGPRGRQAALKILPTDAQGRAEAVARFFRESAAIARLDHPGIVKFFDFGKWRRRYFFTMELIAGRDLHRVIREDGVMHEAQAARVLYQVADALTAIASLGFVHRDLKPENVVLQPDGRAKLIDFGLVKVADTASITAPGDILGTPFFMAPEYIQTGAAPDIRADTYALGIVFHFLLTGRYPFEGNSPAEIFDKHLARAAPAPSLLNRRVSIEADLLCRKLLEKKPRRRPDPAGAMRAFDALARAYGK